MTDHVIDVKDLSKSFGATKVVEGLSLRVAKGEICGFLGANGSGKTTTIRMLCGLLTPDGGSGQCIGYDIIKQSHETVSYTHLDVYKRQTHRFGAM